MNELGSGINAASSELDTPNRRPRKFLPSSPRSPGRPRVNANTTSEGGKGRDDTKAHDACTLSLLCHSGLTPLSAASLQARLQREPLLRVLHRQEFRVVDLPGLREQGATLDVRTARTQARILPCPRSESPPRGAGRREWPATSVPRSPSGPPGPRACRRGGTAARSPSPRPTPPSSVERPRREHALACPRADLRV